MLGDETANWQKLTLTNFPAIGSSDWLRRILGNWQWIVVRDRLLITYAQSSEKQTFVAGVKNVSFSEDFVPCIMWMILMHFKYRKVWTRRKNMKFSSRFISLFLLHENSQLICSTNQLSNFYSMLMLAIKSLPNMSFFE